MIQYKNEVVPLIDAITNDETNLNWGAAIKKCDSILTLTTNTLERINGIAVSPDMSPLKSASITFLNDVSQITSNWRSVFADADIGNYNIGLQKLNTGSGSSQLSKLESDENLIDSLLRTTPSPTYYYSTSTSPIKTKTPTKTKTPIKSYIKTSLLKPLPTLLTKDTTNVVVVSTHKQSEGPFTGTLYFPGDAGYVTTRLSDPATSEYSLALITPADSYFKIYVKFNEPVSNVNYDFSSTRIGNYEMINIPYPKRGIYNIMIYDVYGSGSYSLGIGYTY